MNAYNRWRSDQRRAHEAYICEDRSSPYCVDWVCEHIQRHLRGEYVPLSWRKAIDKLLNSRDRVSSYARMPRAKSEHALATEETEVEPNGAERESGVLAETVPQR
jgi:hypothetical protein